MNTNFIICISNYKETRIKALILVSLFFSFSQLSSHQDFLIEEQSNNVYSRITTGYFTEEISKIDILRVLTERLCKNLDYDNDILFDFYHRYTDETDTLINYKLCYNKELIYSGYLDDSEYLGEFINKVDDNGLIILISGRSFDIQSTLQIVETAIKRSEFYKDSIIKISFNKKNKVWLSNINQKSRINEELSKQISIELDSLISTKTYRLRNNFTNEIEAKTIEFTEGISYFWQNNKFHLFIRKRDKVDTLIKVFENLYKIQFFNYSAIIHDSDSSFYFVNMYKDRKISKRHIVNDRIKKYIPLHFEAINNNVIYCNILYLYKNFQNYYKTLQYLINEDEIIYDLDELIKKR